MISAKIGQIVVGPDVTLTKEQAHEPIHISWSGAKSDRYYTVVMHDPDAPSGNFTHWLVVNIPGNNVRAGNTLIEYYAPSPPSGTHRYYIDIYEQKDRVPLSASQDRQVFPNQVKEQGHLYASILFRVSSI